MDDSTRHLLSTIGPIQQKPGATLSDQVYEEVLRIIVETPIPQGGRLPTEAELCDRFAVSRTVVREALSRLKTDGVIASHRGRGSQVMRRPREVIVEFASIGSIADIQRFFELRQIVEPEIAALAASRRTVEDISRIRTAFEMIQAGFDRNDLAVQEDFDFHLAICKAAKNKYLLSVLEFSRENILKGMRFARELTTDRFSPRSLLAQKEHGAILAAIEDGDEAAARQQMCKHIFNTRNRIFTGTDGDA